MCASGVECQNISKHVLEDIGSIALKFAQIFLMSGDVLASGWSVPSAHSAAESLAETAEGPHGDAQATSSTELSLPLNPATHAGWSLPEFPEAAAPVKVPPPQIILV